MTNSIQCSLLNIKCSISTVDLLTMFSFLVEQLRKFVENSHSVIRTQETFLQDIQVILKRMFTSESDEFIINFNHILHASSKCLLLYKFIVLLFFSNMTY